MSDDAFHLVVAVGVFLACAASIAQAIVLAALFRAGKEAVKAGKEAQGKFAPRLERVDTILVESGRILQENRTQVGEIVKDTLEIAKTARQQTERFSQLLDHANGRAKARLAQIDATVDQTVVQVEQARDAVKNAVLEPVKEVNGIVAGVKAAFITYAQGGNRNAPEHVAQDKVSMAQQS